MHKRPPTETDARESGEAPRREATRPLDEAWLILILGVILGFGLRLSAVLTYDFPLNDGGLFYSMVRDLLANAFHAPLLATYNGAGIPFVYPPLGLYVAAGLTRTGMALPQVFRFLPAVVSAASIPAAYTLACKVLGDRRRAAFAALVVAVVPASFEWRIMGGGVTRSFGFLFGLLCLNALCSLLTTDSRKNIALTAVFGTLTVLSHPEAAVHFAIGALLLCVFRLRRKSAAIAVLLAAALTVCGTALWWWPALSAHGTGPWLGASESRDWYPAHVLFFRLVGSLDAATSILALFGAFWMNRNTLALLLVYTVAMFVILPRSASQFAVLPLAMLVGVGAQVTLDAILKPLDRAASASTPARRRPRPSLVALVILGLLFFVPNWADTAASTLLQGLTPAERAAMNWARENTESESTFLIVEGTEFIGARDAEWFPTLAERKSAVAVQGYEWLHKTEISAQIEAFHGVQACGYEDVNCLEVWSRKYEIPYTHVYVLTHREYSPNTPPCCARLIASLDKSASFERVLTNQDVVIYKRRQ